MLPSRLPLRAPARWQFISLALLPLCLCYALQARAEEQVDDATKNAARDLAQRAAQAYESGDYRTAQDLFHRAYALVQAPTLSLREARALEKLGLLVESAEAYVRTTRARLDPGAPDVFQQAVQDARDELAKLRPRIPRLKIVVEGGDSTLEVTIDGKKLRRELVGVESPANPGNHRLTATTGSGAGASADVSLAEAESKSVVLRLEAGKAQAVASAVPPASGGESPGNGRIDAQAGASGGNTQRTLGFVSLGVGAAGLGVGVVTGLMASSRHSDAEAKCPEARCVEGSPGADDLDAFRSLRTVSTIGYVVGLVGVGAGVTLLITSPKKQESAWVSPFVGAGSAGVRGAF
jgi:hypothetical protein